MKGIGLRLKLAAVTVMAAALPVLAQNRWAPPNKSKGMLQWVVMLGVLILICIPAFMNPKRTHKS